MLFIAFLISSLLLSTLAQSGDPVLDIEAIEAHFKQSGIEPSLISSFNPTTVLTVYFNGVGAISPGEALSKDQTALQPSITVTPANSSVDLSGNFTVVMVDADIVGSDDSLVNRHWLLNFATISSDKVDNSSAVAITPYTGPGPAPGSGAHRYVIIVYFQPANFTPPAEFTSPTGVEKFSLNTYVSDSGLGPIIGATYFTVEVGTATVSVSSTSPVVSSTLAPDSSGRTASGSASFPTSSKNPNGGSNISVTLSSLCTTLIAFIVLVSV